MPIPLSPSLLLVLVALLLAGAPAPARVPAAKNYSLAIASSDPELRASFARFDRGQSPTAAKACALLLNTVPAA